MLNPGQVTVDVADEPLYARSKEVQLMVPGYDKSNYFPMMGAFHIEKVTERQLRGERELEWLQTSSG